MKKYLLSLPTIILSLALVAQQSGVKWKAAFEPRKVFIENKGQFNGQDQVPGSVILFGTDQGSGMIYFSKNGLSYRLEKTEHEPVNKEPEATEGKSLSQFEEAEHQVKVTTALVHMEWVNASPDVQIITEEPVADYYNYSVGDKNISHVAACKKIIYKNLYPGIDVEYVFHPHQGVEYSLLLQPGADISRVKMRYSGTDKISVNKKGEVHISTIFGDIIDHAPSTSATGHGLVGKVPSQFALDGKTISFQLGRHDPSSYLVIDPWTTVPAMPAANSVFNIKSDSVGNAYIYGGDSPFKVMKYSPGGALRWSYLTPWTSANYWFGGLVVDRAGNSYITGGTNPSLTKIDTGGTLVWSNTSPAGTGPLEFWNVEFNCDESQLFIGGTNDSISFNISSFNFHWGFNGDVFNMSLVNGAIAGTVHAVRASIDTSSITTIPIGFDEVRSLCYSPNGNLYYLSRDTVGVITTGLSTGYRLETGYHFPYYMPYSNSGGGQGQNNIRATAQFLYTTDGLTLHKRDINTGNILLTATIPGGSQYNNSGVAIDSCGNVYVGSQNKVVKYDANLNRDTSLATPEAVYDVSIGTNGDVLACGHNFAVALPLSACGQVRTICQTTFSATTSQTNIACSAQCNGTVTANPANGTTPYTYAWPGGVSTQTDTGLCAGTYTVTITDHAGNSVTASATITQTGLPNDSITANKTIMCSGDSARICAPAGFVSYQWNNSATTPCIEATAAGNYYVTVTDNNHCTALSNRVFVGVHQLPPVSFSVKGDTLTAYNSPTYQWYLNGSPIPNATSPVYIATQSGSYAVAVTDTNGCSVLSNKTQVTTGIGYLAGDAGISVYPNPLESGNWHLQVNDDWLGGQYEVYDASGKLVLKSTIRNTESEINLNVACGIYMMKIYSGNKNLALKLIRL